MWGHVVVSFAINSQAICASMDRIFFHKVEFMNIGHLEDHQRWMILTAIVRFSDFVWHHSYQLILLLSHLSNNASFIIRHPFSDGRHSLFCGKCCPFLQRPSVADRCSDKYSSDVATSRAVSSESCRGASVEADVEQYPILHVVSILCRICDPWSGWFH